LVIGKMSELKALFDKHGSDKGDHGYHIVYEEEFAKRRNDEINILEVGVWMGNSIAAMLEYFPKATIYGIDIFTRVKPELVKPLQNSRVHWLQCDSTDPQSLQLIKKHWGDVAFDFIIDDGAHTPDANARTFRNMVQRLSKEGTYWIEDVWPIDKLTDEEMGSIGWFRKKPGVYTREEFAKFKDALDGWKVEEYDLRLARAGQASRKHLDDSYIYEVKR